MQASLMPPPQKQPSWPLGTALGLLLLSGLGLFLSLSTPSDPSQPVPWYANPWLWIATLTSLTVLLGVAVVLTQQRLGRRMRTALLVSLTIHMLLAIFLSEQVMELILDEPAKTEIAEVEPMPTIPDYYLPAPNASRRAEAFESPLETDQVDGPSQQLNRQQQSHDVEARKSPTDIPTPMTLRPSEMVMQRQKLAAPRAADQMSRRSRNEIAPAQRQLQTVDLPRAAQPRDEQSQRPADSGPTLARSESTEFNPRQPRDRSRSSALQANLKPRQVAHAARESESNHLREVEPPEMTRPLAHMQARPAQDLPATPATATESQQTAPAPTSALARRPASRASSTRASQSEASVPRAAAAPRVSGRRQLSRSNSAPAALSTPSNASSRATLAESSANDIEPAPARLARRAVTTPQSSPSQLTRNSSRGRPTARASRTANGAVADTAMTRGVAGQSTLPQSRSAQSTADTRQQTSSQRPRRQVGAATAHQLAAETIDGPVASESQASPSLISPRPTSGSHRSLARPATAAPSTRPAASPGSGQTEGVATAAVPPAQRMGRRSRADAAGEPGSGNANDNIQSSTPRRQQVAASLSGGGAAEAPTSAGTQHQPSSAGRAGTDRLTGFGPSSAEHGVARSRASIPVRIAATTDDGGLGTSIAPVAGLRDRRASIRSETVHDLPGRFLGRRTGSPASLSGRARRAAEPFARRSARRSNQDRDAQGAPLASTEAAIEMGLAYLARVQQGDGHWSFQETGTTGESAAVIVSDTAATGLGLLAFLGAGYDHFEGEYQDQVSAALGFLTAEQRPSGDLYRRQEGPANQGIWLYSHGIAAIALCEAYGMTGDEKLRSAAQRALDFITSAQHPSYGGWRYAPGSMSDLSVSGWQLMALRSGQLAGLDVSDRALAGVRQLLNSAQAPASKSQYVYNPWSQDSRQAAIDRRPNTVMTSVGLLMRLYTGSSRREPAVRGGAELLVDRLPNVQPPPARRSSQNPNRDAYYWYNATQVMFHMQGDLWQQWRDALYPLLTETQNTSGELIGSWDPFQPVPDRWAHHAGRLYVTSMNLLSLEVYYRHLPLYEDGLAGDE